MRLSIDSEGMYELNKKQILLKTVIFISLFTVIAACGNEVSTKEVMTLDQVKSDIQDQALSLSEIEIPKEIISTKIVNQAGFEIGESGDRIYIYEYKNNETLENDNNMIHNNVYQLSMPNSPLIMTSHNVILIYVKKNMDEYDIENKLLQVL